MVSGGTSRFSPSPTVPRYLSTYTILSPTHRPQPSHRLRGVISDFLKKYHNTVTHLGSVATEPAKLHKHAQNAVLTALRSSKARKTSGPVGPLGHRNLTCSFNALGETSMGLCGIW